jgi:hypothetical protein
MDLGSKMHQTLVLVVRGIMTPTALLYDFAPGKRKRGLQVYRGTLLSISHLGKRRLKPYVLKQGLFTNTTLFKNPDSGS